MHPLDEATRLEPMGDGLFAGQTSDAYWNFGGPFGGVTAATLMRAAMDQIGRVGDPVSITVNFTAAIVRGPFLVAARLIRAGKYLRHWYIELTQGGVVAANATAVFAERRKTWSHSPTPFPDVPPSEAIEPMPTNGRNAFVSQFDFRFVSGRLELGPQPDDRPSSPRSCLWFNNAQPRAWDFIGLATFCDLFFGRIYFVRRAIFPIATVSLTAYFHVDAAGLSPLGSRHLLGVADANTFGRGFFDQTAQIWSPEGGLLATTTQIVNYRE